MHTKKRDFFEETRNGLSSFYFCNDAIMVHYGNKNDFLACDPDFTGLPEMGVMFRDFKGFSLKLLL